MFSPQVDFDIISGSNIGGNVGRVLGGGIPVAKVLPQQATTPSQGPVSVSSTPRVPHGQVRAPSPGLVSDPQPAHTSVFLQRAHTGKQLLSKMFASIVARRCMIRIVSTHFSLLIG